MEAKRLNQKTIAALKELQADGQPDILKELVGVFLQSSHQRLEAISGALADKKFDVVKSVVHTLKSSSATLGADQMARICVEMENVLSTRDSSTLLSVFVKLKTEYEIVAAEMEELIR